MSEEKQEGQKTVVSFIVGLLIGGLLVWAFSGPTEGEQKKVTDTEKTNPTEKVDDKPVITNQGDQPKAEIKINSITETPVLKVGEGKVVVEAQTAGESVKLSSATYPVAEGWIGVRDYEAENLGGLLGVVRFSEAQGLVPSEIVLQRSTVTGKTYAVVVYSEDGDRAFNLATDKQIDTIFATFVAK